MIRKFFSWLNDIEIKLFVWWWITMDDFAEWSANRHK